MNDLVERYLRPRLEQDFGINLKALDIAHIEVDKEADGYDELRRVTAKQQTKTIEAQTDVGIKGMQDTQRITAENMQESLRIQREEAQRAQKLQTESQNINVHQLNLQADVSKAAAESLGTMGAGGGDGMNVGAMMAGMTMGGAVGSGMAGAIGGMMNGMNQPAAPPPPQVQYNVSVNGQQSGPFNLGQLQQMVQNGQLTRETYVWKQGMAGWELAGNVQELSSLFGAVPPPSPPPAP